MQNICMMLFFTSVGYTASISLIKRGGVMVLKMAIVTTVLIICQNIIGSGLAMAFNLSPLLGLATGSIPMVGGHGTAAAFGPLLESIGLDGGVTIAVAAATFGLVAGGVIGGPIGEELVHKFHLVSSAESERFDPSFNAGTVSTLKAVAGNKERAENAIKIENKIGQTIDNYRFMNAMAHLFLAMGLGTLVSGFFSSIGLVFPGYIGSMIVAAIIRNESSFRTDAESSVGARGLMQLMPDTAEWIAGKIGDSNYSFDHLYDAETNIRYGCWYLNYLSKLFRGDAVLVSSAYHAGQTTVTRWLSDKSISSDGVTIPVDKLPDGPTKQYAGRVTTSYGIYEALLYPNESAEAAGAADGDIVSARAVRAGVANQ